MIVLKMKHFSSEKKIIIHYKKLLIFKIVGGFEYLYEEIKDINMVSFTNP